MSQDREASQLSVGNKRIPTKSDRETVKGFGMEIGKGADRGMAIGCCLGAFLGGLYAFFTVENPGPSLGSLLVFMGMFGYGFGGLIIGAILGGIVGTIADDVIANKKSRKGNQSPNHRRQNDWEL